MQGGAMRNLFMFKKLCGPHALKNVILATTMWEKVDEADGEERERQLAATPDFWGTMKDNGSQIVRHHNNSRSAMALIRTLVATRRENPNIVLDIQAQMVDSGKTLGETAAGSALETALAAEQAKYQSRLEQSRVDMQEALAAADRQSAEMLAKHEREMDEKVKRLQTDQEQLNISMQRLHEEKYKKMFEELELSRKQSEMMSRKVEVAERFRKQQEAQISESKQQQAENQRKHNADLDDLQARLDKVAKTQPRTRSHPGRNRINDWTVSVSVYGEHFFYVAVADKQ
jgi:hypothetical protein